MHSSTIHISCITEVYCYSPQIQCKSTTCGSEHMNARNLRRGHALTSTPDLATALVSPNLVSWLNGMTSPLPLQCIGPDSISVEPPNPRDKNMENIGRGLNIGPLYSDCTVGLIFPNLVSWVNGRPQCVVLGQWQNSIWSGLECLEHFVVVKNGRNC